MKSWDRRFCCISWGPLSQPRWWIVWPGISLRSLWFAKIYNIVKASLAECLKEHVNQHRDFDSSILCIHVSPEKSRILPLRPVSIPEPQFKFWGLELLRYDLLFISDYWVFWFRSVKSVTMTAHRSSGSFFKVWKWIRQNIVISGVIFCTWGLCWVLINHQYSLCSLKSMQPLSWLIV